MSFSDMIKKSVVSGFNTDVTVAQIIIGLLVSLAAAIFILFIYRVTMRGVAQNRGFEVTMLLVTSISAMIVLTITSNLALSLGMVGALSIIRFRTAIKDASDTAFMFWAVAAGITAGAGFYLITAIGCLFIGIITVIAVRITKNAARPYLLVVRAIPGVNPSSVEKILSDANVRRKLSSSVQNDRYTEVIYEVAVSASQQKLVGSIKGMPGVTSVSLVDCRNG
ncbi:MAG: DUF4956 domain-containing protein [Clostridia bacterium]|nr:DUF4956 domain-containing protein [Clostridia bacterium]